MLQWQLVGLLILSLTSICIASPLNDDDSKPCFQLTGSFNGNAVCAQFCRKKGNPGGSCQRKRCVCINKSDSDDDDDDQ